MTRRLLALAAVAVAAGFAFGDDPPKPVLAPTPTAPDVRDMLFLSEGRPLLIRLHLQLDGKPLPDAFAAFLEKLFQHYDLDGDGVLSKREAGRLPAAQAFANWLTGQGDTYSLEYEKAGLDAVDASPKDGKVTPEEVATYYRKSGLRLFRVELNGQRETAARLTKLLTRHMDRDKDGQLSPEEIADGIAALRKLDVEQDDSITRDELLLWQGPYVNEYVQQDGDGPRRAAPESPLVAVEPGEPLQPLIAKMLKRFDEDRDLKLSAEESGFAKELFVKLDADKDGGLDEKELAGWFGGPSDLELVVRWSSGKSVGGMLAQPLVGLAKNLNPQDAVQVFAPPGHKPPLNAVVVKEQNQLVATLLDCQARLSASNTNARERLAAIKKHYQQAIQRTDGNGDGALDRKEAEKATNDDYFLRGLWAIADRNGDGRLTEAELMAWLDLEAEGATAFAVLTVEDQGRGLFEQLDANADNRLSLREFRGGWERVKNWDRDNDGRLGPDEAPQLFSVTLSQGRLNHPYYQLTALNLGMPSIAVAAKGKGPAWFRKMDRNGDGDLSLREWLGSEEEFHRADGDGDGLISVAEAERCK